MKEEVKNRSMTDLEVKLESLWDYIATMIGFEPKELEVQNAIKEFVKLKQEEVLEKYKEKIIKNIEKAKEEVRNQTGSFKYDEQYDECINFIK